MHRLLALLISVATLVGCVSQAQLMSSPNEIRQSLLSKTPLGINKKLAQERLLQEGVVIKLENHGFLRQEPGLPLITVGVYSIRASLGDYCLLLCTNVTAFWGFDQDEKLIELWVWKTTDAP